MPERLNGVDSKSNGAKAHVGSNPTLSVLPGGEMFNFSQAFYDVLYLESFSESAVFFDFFNSVSNIPNFNFFKIEH